MLCSQGHENDDAAKFCSSCGEALASSDPPQSPKADDESAGSPISPLISEHNAEGGQPPPPAPAPSGGGEESATSEAEHGRRRWLLLLGGGATLLVLIILGVVITTGGSDQREIRGLFTLFDTDGVTGDIEDCEGEGGYSDVDAGMPVTVRNAQGDIVGSSTTYHGTLAEAAARSHLVENSGETGDEDELEEMRATLEDIEGFACPLLFEVSVDDADFYEIEVGRRGALSFRDEELADDGWVVNFTLGS